MIRLSLVAGLALVSACYTYRPIQNPAPAAGSQVDVALDDEGTRALAGTLGPDIEHVHGTVLGADSSGVRLAVSEVQDVRGQPTAWSGERIEIPGRYVARIEERRLAAASTGVLGGAIAAGLVAAYELFGGNGTVEGPLGGAPGGASR